MAYGEAVTQFVSKFWELVREIGLLKKSIKAVCRVGRINIRVFAVFVMRGRNLLQIVKVYSSRRRVRRQGVVGADQEVILVGGIQENILRSAFRDRRVIKRCALFVRRTSKDVVRNGLVCTVFEGC